MTLVLSIDFETSGLVRKGLDRDHPSQPHITEIGASLVGDDDIEVGIQSTFIQPVGWEIEDGAAAVNGITTAHAQRFGVDLRKALIYFSELVRKADVVIAHNMNFERMILEMELMRLKSSGDWWQKANKLCTMEQSTPVLKLPGQYDDYKFPKLIEAHAHLVPTVAWDPKHRALGDARAALRVYRALQALEAVT